MLDAIDSMASKIYGMGRVRIKSELSRPEVARRIDKLVSERPFLSDGLVGRVTDEKIVVSQKRAFLKIPFKPVLRATIEETDEGTVVDGQFTLSRRSMIGMLPFMALMGSVGIAIAVGEAEAGRASDALLSSAGFVIAFVAGAIFVALSMRISRSDAGVIRSSIRKAIGPRV